MSTPIEEVIEGANAVDTVNQNFGAVRGSFVGAYSAADSVDLNFAIYGGKWGSITVDPATVTLADDDVNYIVMEIATGDFSSDTGLYDWNDGANFRRCLVVTASGGLVHPNNIEDLRFGPGGLFNGAFGAGSGVVVTVIAGDNIDVDSTDPANPIISAVLPDRNTVTALSNVSGTVTINCALGDYFTLALGANVSTLAFSNLPGSGKGITLMVRITQDSTPRTVAWPASFRWEGAPPTVSTASGAIDVLAITTFDNGTKWDGTLSKGRA